MRKVRTLLVLGIWATILPYLGFSYAWKDILFTLSGLVIVYLGYIFYQDYKTREIKVLRKVDSFKENGDFIEREITEIEEKI
jgi:membrane protein implicated in regulation of membrane protease activity